MKRTAKRLDLTRSTIRELTPARLGGVAGGKPFGCNGDWTSYSSYYSAGTCDCPSIALCDPVQ